MEGWNYFNLETESWNNFDSVRYCMAKKTMSLSTPHLGPKPNSVVREKCSRWFLLLYTITYTKGLSRITISSLGSCPLSSLWFKTKTESKQIGFWYISLNNFKLSAFTLISTFFKFICGNFWSQHICLFGHSALHSTFSTLVLPKCLVHMNKRFFLNNNSNQ